VSVVKSRPVASLPAAGTPASRKPAATARDDDFEILMWRVLKQPCDFNE
jgi:hypothetical protein